MQSSSIFKVFTSKSIHLWGRLILQLSTFLSTPTETSSLYVWRKQYDLLLFCYFYSSITQQTILGQLHPLFHATLSFILHIYVSLVANFFCHASYANFLYHFLMQCYKFPEEDRHSSNFPFGCASCWEHFPINSQPRGILHSSCRIFMSKFAWRDSSLWDATWMLVV